MITEEATEDLLVDLLQRRAEDRADAQLVMQTVRERTAGGRVTSSRTALTLLVAAAVVAIALVSTFAFRTRSVNEAAAPAVAVNHPGEDQLTHTCLDMSKVLTSWGNPTNGRGGIAEDLPDGSQCSREADILLPTHPATVSSVSVGPRTVSITQSPAEVRTGFIALTASESAAAAAASGENLNPNRPYYLIVSIPADNPQAVLISILQQFQLPG